eukprot:2870854-Rhodomonas_salina.1
MSERVRPAGIAIDTSEHGLEGYNKWQAAAENGEGYDLIITDVVMPLMSGPEMVHTSSLHHPETPHTPKPPYPSTRRPARRPTAQTQRM